MAITCAVFIERISRDSARGTFDFLTIPASGQSVLLPGIGLNTDTAHTVRDVIHTAASDGGKPSVAIIVSAERR
jgi:hypothetical protein